MRSTFMTTLLYAVAVILLTLATWASANTARGVYQARQAERAQLESAKRDISTIIQFLQYNIQQGRVVPVPAPPVPASTPPAPPSSGVQSGNPRPAPDTAR